MEGRRVTRYFKMADRLFGTFFRFSHKHVLEKMKQQTTAKTNDTIAQLKLTLQSIILVCRAKVCLKHLFFVSLGPDKALYSFPACSSFGVIV